MSMSYIKSKLKGKLVFLLNNSLKSKKLLKNSRMKSKDLKLNDFAYNLYMQYINLISCIF